MQYILYICDPADEMSDTKLNHFFLEMLMSYSCRLMPRIVSRGQISYDPFEYFCIDKVIKENCALIK